MNSIEQPKGSEKHTPDALRGILTSAGENSSRRRAARTPGARVGWPEESGSLDGEDLPSGLTI